MDAPGETRRGRRRRAAAPAPTEVEPAGEPPAGSPVEARLTGRDAIDLLVPDGTPLRPALARTTDLGVGAHPDDLELLMLAPIGGCRGRPDRWFTGITATDGAGSPRAGRFADLGDEAMAAVRRAEQREAGALGGYSALVQLGYASAAVRAGGDAHHELVADLTALLGEARPTVVYTHNLADRHPTHVAVAAATVEAARALPAGERPERLLGVEGWRDLDWLPDDDRVELDASEHESLGRRLAACFASQVEGGKRYDRAIEGRRRANATLTGPWRVDEATAVTVAMDLTPLIGDDDLDPAAYVAAAAERFRHEVETTVAAAFGR